jgi:O-antigen/teichoic acid export membrane protein
LSSELARATTRGVMWTGISQLSRQVFQLVVVVILARLLFPEDFGVIAIAVFFMGLVGRVRLGFSFSIIQRKEISEGQLSTLFWAGIVAGVVMWGICAAASPLIAAFFGNDIVGPVLTVLSVGFIVSSFGTVPSGLINRNMEFKKLAVVEIGGGIATGGLSIWLAYTHFGVWSLVWGDLLGNLVMIALLWKLCNWRPRLHFSLGSLRELSGFGAAVVGNGMVNHLGTEMDKLLVGRLLSSAALGLYSQASRLSQFPRLNLAQVVLRVAFPAFSRVQDEDARLRRGYLRSVAYISLVTFPLLVGLGVVAPEFVRVVYGTKWVEMIVPLQVLCIAGVVSTIGTAVGSVAFAKGRADLLLKLNLLKIPLILATLLIGSRYGVVGVSTAVSVFFVAYVLFTQVFINRLIKLGMVGWFRSLYPATLGSVGMVAVLLPLHWAAVTFLSIPDVILLVSLAIVGTAAYLLTLWIARIKELGELRRIAGDLLSPYMAVVRRRVLNRPVPPSAVKEGSSQSGEWQ